MDWWTRGSSSLQVTDPFSRAFSRSGSQRETIDAEDRCRPPWRLHDEGVDEVTTACRVRIGGIHCSSAGDQVAVSL